MSMCYLAARERASKKKIELENEINCEICGDYPAKYNRDKCIYLCLDCTFDSR